VVRDPYKLENLRIDEADKTIKTALERLGRELENNNPACKCASSELGVRSEESLGKFHSGSEIKNINRYNRIVKQLREDDFEISARQFEFGSEGVTYIPGDQGKRSTKT